MAFAQRIIFLFCCVTVSFGQRIPQALYEPVDITAAQEIRIQTLDTVTVKTQAQQEEWHYFMLMLQLMKNPFCFWKH